MSNPQNINKAPRDWEDEELIAWANGEVKGGRNVNDSSIANEAVKRFGLEQSDVDGIKQQVLAEQENIEDTTEPSDELSAEVQEQADVLPGDETETPKEVTVKNVEGDGPISQVTVSRSVSAQAEDEVTPMEPAPTHAVHQPPMDEPEADVPETSSAQLQPALTQERPAQQTTTVQKGTNDLNREVFEQNMQDYLKTMRPGAPTKAADGIRAQQGLWRTIRFVLNQSGSDFTAYYSRMLEIIKENRDGAFNERYAFRFWDSIALNPTERRTFERLLNLMITTCDRATRTQALKQVDLEATVKGLQNQDAAQRLQEFYSTI